MEPKPATEAEHAVEEHVEQGHKKGRHRKKQLYNSILQQMEFYFGDSNLAKDRFLGKLTQEDPYVELSIFLKFNKIRKLTSNIEDIAKALKKSTLLELSEDTTKVKRKVPLSVKQNVDECTVYVERIKPEATHDWLSTIFSEFGTVVYVSLPKYRSNRMNKGFAFIEYDKESEAKQALEFFEGIGCKMSSHMAPEELRSIATFEGEAKDKLPEETGGEEVSKEGNVGKEGEVVKDGEMNEDKEVVTKIVELEQEDTENQKKRKRSNGTESDCKKVKVETEENSNNTVEGEETEEKKKKKSKKVRKVNFKELGMQMLSKIEWKKMRNKYLNTQKEKMVQLKQYLYKKKFMNKYDENKQKKSPYNSEDSKEVPEFCENEEKSKWGYTPGVIVKAKLTEPCYDVKKTKSELKAVSPDMQYVDVPHVGSDEVMIRFSSSESAKKFCKGEFPGEAVVLEGQEEAAYWEKIDADKSNKFNKQTKKVRGRDKLLKKAEKELGKHIKFDDSD